MRGSDLCDELRRQLNCASDTVLAMRLGITQGYISQIRKKDDISARSVARFMKRAAATDSAAALKSVIHPIIEFYPIELSHARERGRDIPFDTRSEHGKELKSLLNQAKGLHSFYNSEAEVIYFGKTEKLSLYGEIVNAFNRTLPSFTLYRVRHPWGRYRATRDNGLRKIRKETVTLSETASYFSAYSVSPQLIGGLEALIIRIAPNDIINVKIESKDMKAFTPPKL